MATAKLKLPPGFYKNGTAYQGAGRWIDGDLMRWHNNVLKPITGWQLRYDFGAETDLPPIFADPTVEAVRSGIVLTDSVNGINTFLGTNAAIYLLSNTNVVSDVTPAGFVPEAKDAVQASGYGLFRYSFGQYGTPRPAVQQAVPNAFSWGFAEWGFWPLACARQMPGVPLQVKRDSDATFVDVAGSPEGANDVIVTDERFAMTFGKVDDYRLVEWSDREDFEDWTPAVSNQAGNQRLAGTGRLIRGVKVINQILILGENDAFSGRYVGPPYVYGFNRVGSKCGIIGPEAVATTEQFAMWLGDLSFWRFDGTVSEVPCEVMDFYQADHRKGQRSKTVAFTISDYSEIWWLYQSNQSPTTEPDSYVIYNWQYNKWYTGRIDRTWGVDSDPLYYPMMVSSAGSVYDHEVTSAGREGRIPFIESGPLETADGDRLLGMSHVLPDDKLRGDIKMRLSVRDNAQDANPRYFRDFVLADPTPTTGIMGRDVRMRLEGALVGPNWVVGDFRVSPLKGVTPGR
jgi:hypothetical protein